MAALWKSYLSEQDAAVLKRGGFGKRMGFGKYPTIVVIDGIRATVFDSASYNFRTIVPQKAG